MGIHFARQMNLNRAETASKCSIPPFVLDAYFKASRNYSGAQCAQAISHIRHCDKQVKGVESPSIDHGEALVDLLTSIMLS
jgi:DNA polymerase III delta subunit